MKRKPPEITKEKLERTMRRFMNYDIMTKGESSKCLYCLAPSIYHIQFCDEICRELFEDELYGQKKK